MDTHEAHLYDITLVNIDAVSCVSCVYVVVVVVVDVGVVSVWSHTPNMFTYRWIIILPENPYMYV